MKVLFALAMAAFIGYTYFVFTKGDRELAEHKRIIEELSKTLDRVWAEELVGDMRVDSLETNPETGQKEMHLTFVQYKPGEDVPVFEKSMVLPGEEFYVDALVAKFQRGFVEGGDPLRGKSLLLFRRAFGDAQKPTDGVSLHRGDGELTNVLIPEFAQIDNAPSQFEQELWVRFWQLANDREQAAASGLSVVQGEAPHMKPAVGQVYKLTLRASGGLNMTPRLPAAVLRKRARSQEQAPAR